VHRPGQEGATHRIFAISRVTGAAYLVALWNGEGPHVAYATSSIASRKMGPFQKRSVLTVDLFKPELHIAFKKTKKRKFQKIKKILDVGNE
jgi:hypothetical protein